MTRPHQVLQPGKYFADAHGCCALAIMTKVPRAGQVKTRLCPPLSPAEAAALNICFLQDIASAIQGAAGRSIGVGCYTPKGEEEAYRNILPDSFLLIPQRGETFGQRLAAAIEDSLAVGFESVCLINSDSPAVPASSFRRAVETLASPNEQIVLGPSDDGGYYLIGMKKLYPELFEGIHWSTEKVFAQTLQRATEIGVAVHLLPGTYDVDDQSALDRLCQDLLSPNQAEQPSAPATREFLQQWRAATISA